MPDREKVIKGLERCIEHEDCGDCPYANACDDPFEFAAGCLMYDALTLLKEQEAEIERPKKIGILNMTCRNAFIPLDIQCFWCNGQMHRGTAVSGTLNCVTYFCKQCGGVSHFAVNNEQKISSIEVEYKSPDKET